MVEECEFCLCMYASSGVMLFSVFVPAKCGVLHVCFVGFKGNTDMNS